MSNPCRLDDTTQNKIAYAMGYEKGRADAIEEYESADIPLIHGKAELEEHDKKIRADAIDECIGAVNSEYIENINLVPYRLVKRLEQLKEKSE